MKPMVAILYGVGVFAVGVLAAIALMFMFAELFDFNEQLDNLGRKIKEWLKRD